MGYRHFSQRWCERNPMRKRGGYAVDIYCVDMYIVMAENLWNNAIRLNHQRQTAAEGDWWKLQQGFSLFFFESEKMEKGECSVFWMLSTVAQQQSGAADTEPL